MANEDNLIMNSERTPRERQEMAKNGGKKSGEIRRRSKSFREAFCLLLNGKIEHNGLVMPGYDALALEAFKKALGGDITAMKEIRDTVGEKPTDKIQGEVKFNSGGLQQTLEELKRRE